MRGVQFRGLLFYIKDLNLTKIRAHIKYVYVRPQILSLVKREDENTIKVNWRYVGLSTFRLAIRYIILIVKANPNYLVQVHSG